MNWTQIIITAITTLGTVLSGVFAARSRTHAGRAAVSADRAVEASMRPARDFGANDFGSLFPTKEED